VCGESRGALVWVVCIGCWDGMVYAGIVVANIRLGKSNQIIIFSANFEFLCFQYDGLGFRNPRTTLVGPSPAPDLCMHMLRRSMPLWRVWSSASVAVRVVGALHVFLCFFQASFWQEGEQK